MKYKKKLIELIDGGIFIAYDFEDKHKRYDGNFIPKYLWFLDTEECDEITKEKRFLFWKNENTNTDNDSILLDCFDIRKAKKEKGVESAIKEKLLNHYWKSKLFEASNKQQDNEIIESFKTKLEEFYRKFI